MLRIIAHVDMDAFFAAIEGRDAPALRGLPLVVGADPRGGKGLDDSPIEEHLRPKSVGGQHRFDQDTLDRDFVFTALHNLCRDVVGRLQSEGFSGFRTIVLTVRFADFETKARAHTLEEATADEAVLKREAHQLLLPFLEGR